MSSGCLGGLGLGGLGGLRGFRGSGFRVWGLHQGVGGLGFSCLGVQGFLVKCVGFSVEGSPPGKSGVWVLSNISSF